MGSRQDEADGASAALVCARCGFVSRPDPKFCSQCGARLGEQPVAAIRGDHPPARGAGAALERRQITVAFCDLVGSTSLAAELDPEDYRAILTEFHHCVATAMTEFGGHVARFLGDGELIFFG